MAYTNGIESFWAMLKRGYYDIYHHMSAKHLQRYVNEFAGRHNIRRLGTGDRMASASGFVTSTSSVRSGRASRLLSHSPSRRS